MEKDSNCEYCSPLNCQVHKLTVELKSSNFVIGLLEDVMNSTITPPTHTMNEGEIQCNAASIQQTVGDSFTEMKLNIQELNELCHISV